MDDIITLVGESFTQNEIGVSVSTPVYRDVFATINSVTRAEFFSAGEHGLRPEFMVLTPAINYLGEDLMIIHGKRYAIYRTYTNGEDIELYVQEEVGTNVQRNSTRTTCEDNC